MEVLLALALLTGHSEGKAVYKLGDRSFRVRQYAEETLAKAGSLPERMMTLPAYDWLGATHSDPEVALRCRRLAEGIRAERLKMYQAKAKAAGGTVVVSMEGKKWRVYAHGAVHPVLPEVEVFKVEFAPWVPRMPAIWPPVMPRADD